MSAIVAMRVDRERTPSAIRTTPPIAAMNKVGSAGNSACRCSAHTPSTNAASGAMSIGYAAGSSGPSRGSAASAFARFWRARVARSVPRN